MTMSRLKTRNISMIEPIPTVVCNWRPTDMATSKKQSFISLYFGPVETFRLG